MWMSVHLMSIYSPREWTEATKAMALVYNELELAKIANNWNHVNYNRNTSASSFINSIKLRVKWMMMLGIKGVSSITLKRIRTQISPQIWKNQKVCWDCQQLKGVQSLAPTRAPVPARTPVLVSTHNVNKPKLYVPQHSRAILQAQANMQSRATLNVIEIKSVPVVTKQNPTVKNGVINKKPAQQPVRKRTGGCVSCRGGNSLPGGPKYAKARIRIMARLNMNK